MSRLEKNILKKSKRRKIRIIFKILFIPSSLNANHTQFWKILGKIGRKIALFQKVWIAKCCFNGKIYKNNSYLR